MVRMPSARVQLQEGEVLLRKSRANLQTTFIVPLGGRLHLTSKRLIFLPDRFSIPIPARRAKDTILGLASVTVVEAMKGDMTNLLAGSFRRRLHVQCNEASYLFQVWRLEEWVKSLSEAVACAT
jgi:hypothetical protein